MTISEQNVRGHVVALALPFWSHTKELVALLAKMIRLHRTYATLFTDEMLHEQICDEASRQFALKGEEDIRKLLRVIALKSPVIPYQFDAYKSAFLESYRVLFEEAPIALRPESSDLYEAIAAPRLAVIDFFCYEAMKGIRSISGAQVPVYAWQHGAVTAGLYIFGPESMGGNGDLAEKISRITMDDPEERDRQIEMLYRRIKEKLVEIPGLPPMYDYEHVAQDAAIATNQAAVALFIRYAHRFLEECDGVIHSAHRSFEGEALDKWQEWFGTRLVLALGLVSPPASAEDIEIEKRKSPTLVEVETFLYDALDKFGPNSVVYIDASFQFDII